ncbi:MAG: hypothetical protein JXX14_16330 [Deltaproteobacteria bacterium]|nr:hypothetical protein [Deltaproteobacteria bacterium]
MKTLSKVIIAFMGSGLLAGCGGYFSEQKATNGDAPQISSCEMKATLDDFEDSNNKSSEEEGRGGWIYTFKDGLGTEVEFPQGDFRVYPGGVGDSKYCARFRGTTAKSGGDIYAGWGFNLSPAEGASWDASKYSGISFLAKRGNPEAVGVFRVNVADVNTDPAGKICTDCFNHFGAPVKLTDQWVRYVVYFDEMEQRAGWGAPRPDHIDKSSLISVQFQTTIPNIKFDVLVDDIRFIGACNESYLQPREEKTAAPEPAPEPAPAAAPASDAPADDAAGDDADASEETADDASDSTEG